MLPRRSDILGQSLQAVSQQIRFPILCLENGLYVIENPKPSRDSHGSWLPSIKALKQECATLNAENKKLCPDQKAARKEMIDLLTAKSNLERFLEIKIEQPDRKGQQQEESR